MCTYKRWQYWNGGVWGGIMDMERWLQRHPHMGPYLPIEVAYDPHLLCGKFMWGQFMCGRWVVKLCYMSWSDGMSCKTLSQMCGSWYFPKFLWSEGSLTHIQCLLYVPGDPQWFHLEYGEALKAYWVLCGMTVLMYSRGGPGMFLEPIPKGSAWFPYTFLQAVDMWALKSI